MPEERLRRTRDAYQREPNCFDILKAVDQIAGQYRLVTDDQGVTHRIREPQRFRVIDWETGEIK